MNQLVLIDTISFIAGIGLWVVIGYFIYKKFSKKGIDK